MYYAAPPMHASLAVLLYLSQFYRPELAIHLHRRLTQPERMKEALLNSTREAQKRQPLMPNMQPAQSQDFLLRYYTVETGQVRSKNRRKQ
jgi:hypothetical protein